MRLHVALILLCSSVPLGCQALPASEHAAQTRVIAARLQPPQNEITLTGGRVEDDPLTLPEVPAAAPGGQIIDLGQALSLAGVDNPTIALAQQAIVASQARLLQAETLLLPTLEAGADFDWHEGTLQSVQGIIRDLDRSSVYVGAGAGAVGAGTVTIPGVRLIAHLGDAFLEPRAAQQLVAGRQQDALAIRNTVLLEVGLAYFDLAGASVRLQANRQSEKEFAEIARLTRLQAEAQQAKKVDALRAQTELLLIQSAGEALAGELAAASAKLARLLDLDPSVPLQSPAGPLPFLELVHPGEPLEALIQIALTNRPEMGARAADLAAAQTRVQQEMIRPFLPVVSAGFSAGGFGGGGNQVEPSFSQLRSRTDFDVTAVWTLQNFGFGNLALQRRRRAEAGEASAEQLRVIDQVRAEVAEAQALVHTRREQVEIARRRMQSSFRGFQADLLLAKNLGVLPIALLDSAKLLNSARQDFVQALVGYNQAELQLFVALGQPPLL
jgi:outer membrane protein TolC